MILNLTANNVNIHLTSGQVHTIEPQPTPARAQMNRMSTETVPLSLSSQHIPVTQVELGKVEYLPPEEPGITLIVSRLILEHPDTASRKDLVCVDRAIRDQEGRVIGCKGFSRRNKA